MEAGSAQAAAYLENFVEEGVRWIHMDIAGTTIVEMKELDMHIEYLYNSQEIMPINDYLFNSQFRYQCRFIYFLIIKILLILLIERMYNSPFKYYLFFD